MVEMKLRPYMGKEIAKKEFEQMQQQYITRIMAPDASVGSYQALSTLY